MTQEKTFSYLESLAFSDPGLVRRNNEDSCACLPQDGCYFVSDGMGGGSAGEEASQIIEEYITDAVRDTADDSPGGRKYAVQQALHRANHTIFEYAQAHSYSQMGATLALLLADPWDPAKAWLCHVGDSRIYRLRQGKILRLTRDHTVGAEIAEKTSDRDAADHVKSSVSHILTRAIGVSGRAQPEWKEIDMEPGDLFLLCTDGVSTMLNDGEIQSVLVPGDRPLEEMIGALSARIREAGAKDNYTVILCRVSALPPAGGPRTEEEIRENEYLLKISEERIDHA